MIRHIATFFDWKVFDDTFTMTKIWAPFLVNL